MCLTVVGRSFFNGFMHVSTEEQSPRRGWLPSAAGVVLALVGLALLVGGVQLATLGGSWYDLMAGQATLASGLLLFRRKPRGALLCPVIVIATGSYAAASPACRRLYSPTSTRPLRKPASQ